MRSLENQHKSIFTLGVPKENIVNRILLHNASIKNEPKEIERLTKEDWRKLTNILNELSKADIRIDEKSCNFDEIKTCITRHINSGHSIDEIVIIGRNSNESLNNQLINLAKKLKKSITFSFEI